MANTVRVWGVCGHCCVAKAFQRCQGWEDTEENDLGYSRLNSLCAEEVNQMAHWEENGGRRCSLEFG